MFNLVCVRVEQLVPGSNGGSGPPEECGLKWSGESAKYSRT